MQEYTFEILTPSKTTIWTLGPAKKFPASCVDSDVLARRNCGSRRFLRRSDQAIKAVVDRVYDVDI